MFTNRAIKQVVTPKLLWWRRPSHAPKDRTAQTNPTLSQLLPLPSPHNPTRLLARLRPADRARILDSTLACCSTDESGALAAELVELAAQSRMNIRELAFRILARRFAQIGETDRDVAVRLRHSQGGEWGTLIKRDTGSLTESEGASIAMLAGWVGEASLLDHLAALASHPDEGVASAVDQSLARLVAQLGSMQAHAAASVTKALSAAVSAYGEHRRRGVLRAAAMLWGSPAGIDQLEHLNADGTPASWWIDPTHPAQLGLRALIRRDADPAFARAALCWVRLEVLAPACRDRLLEAATSGEHEQILAAGHLLAHPARRAAIESLSIPAATRPDRPAPRSAPRVERAKGLRWITSPDALAHVDADSRRFAPAWTSALAIPAKEKHAALGAFVGDRSPAVRHAAVRAAADIGDADVLSDFCFDDHADVAVSAATARLCLRPPAGAGLMSDHLSDEVGAWGRLSRSSHAGVRRVAEAALERYAGAKVGTPSHTLILRRRARRGRAGVLDELKTQISEGSDLASMGAIRAAVRLGLVDDLKVELVRALWREPAAHAPIRDHDDAPLAFNRVAASAAMALAETDDDATDEALRACLSHLDVRVRSNALEAIGKRSRRAGFSPFAGRHSLASRGSGLRVLIEFKDDEHHRLRATAGWMMFLQSMLRSDASADAWGHEAERLGETMLRDDRDGHQLAGLWLSERLLPHVSETARTRLAHAASDLIAHPDASIGERAVRYSERCADYASDAPAVIEPLRTPRPLTEAA